MSDLVNPYIAGAPVVETRMFFGREDVFEWIQNSLTGRYADHILVIHGQRRVGKTSVLKQLGNRLPKKYIPVFFDLQGRTHTTIDRFLWWLAREIVRVLKQDRDITVPAPEKDIFSSDPEYFEHRFLPELRPFLGEHALLLTFDEFDNLEESEVKEELARPLIDYLRRLMGEEGMNFIFSIGSSGRKLENMQAAYTEFFKAALYKKISFLNQEQTAGLVTRPVEGLLEYDPEAVKRIYGITSGHPYFTQLTCHELFSFCQRTGELRIRETDVEAVLDDVVERGTVNLKFTWDEASDIERWSLAALAHEKTPLDNRNLAEYLHKQRVRFSEPDLISGVLHLREKDILTEQNQFVIHLLRLWLQKNRTIEQVREELTEVNPIANRYIEIGLEFQDAGQYDRAIENFREALNVAPDHIQAQVNIALAYQAQGVLDQAVLEFGKALAIDDEDVSARSGLCSAHLALGDAAIAKNRPRDAINSYQKVLEINAEHTEARQRMAEINRQRAEKAMVEGRDEEALAAFAEALRFTPEDETLSSRYEQAKVEKRTKVVANLLVKADKERSARNWDGALAILQNALEIDPQNEKVQKRLEMVRDEQRKTQLTTILARAERAAQGGRWGLVIAALEEYLILEPGDSRIRTRIDEARQELNEAQVEEARNRARTLTRQERFEEALVAWDEYRKINPADEQTVQVEVEKIRKVQALARAYGEAQAAFTKKNYDRAVALFKDIVVQDENYRDASRRMAEAIELRRKARKWWQSRWLWGGVGLAAAATMIWLGIRFGMPLLATLQSPPAGTDTPGLTGTSVIGDAPPTLAAATALPTATAQPLPYTWTRLNSGQFLPRDAVNAIVIDPNDPGVIYVGMFNAGIYKSIDGGLSWQPIQSGLSRTGIASLVIEPDNPATLYAATFGGGVYKTINQGNIWQAVNTGIEVDYSGSMQLIMDPTDSQHLFLASNALYEILNGGDTWSKVNQSSCPDNFWKIAIHPENSNILFAAAGFGQSGAESLCQPGVYISRDSGRTWNLTSEVADVQRLFINPTGDQLLILKFGDDGGLYISSDEGVTWNFLTTTACFSLAFDPGNKDLFYCGSNHGTVEKTDDGGQTWKTILDSEGQSHVRAIMLSPYDPQTIWAGRLGFAFSDDGGQTWETRDSGLGTNFTLTIDPYDNNFLYAASPFGWQLYRSSDKGQTWKSIESEGAFSFGSSGGILLRDLGDGTFLFTHDRGDTWETITSEQAGNYSQIPDEVSYRLSEAGNSFERSADSGQTWEACAETGMPNTFGSPLSVDPQDKNRLLVATLGNGISISTDGCASWTPINNGLGSLFANVVAIDPNDPNIFYAGTDGGAYVSFNSGQSWGAINDGLLGATVVYSIVVDKDSNVYAATPYGIFLLEGR